MNNDNNEECMDEEAVLLDSDEDLSDCDDGNVLSDVIRYSSCNEPPENKWVFHARTDRGGKVFDGLSRCVYSEKFSLQYNPVNAYLSP